MLLQDIRPSGKPYLLCHIVNSGDLPSSNEDLIKGEGHQELEHAGGKSGSLLLMHTPRESYAAKDVTPAGLLLFG